MIEAVTHISDPFSSVTHLIGAIAFASLLVHPVTPEAHDLITAEYAVARRPQGRVLVDYNQNAWGQTLASVYSVRPHPRAAVSTPVTWDEIDDGVAIEDFHIRNVPARVREKGDLWAPLLAPKGRFELEKYR